MGHRRADPLHTRCITDCSPRDSSRATVHSETIRSYDSSHRDVSRRDRGLFTATIFSRTITVADYSTTLHRPCAYDVECQVKHAVTALSYIIMSRSSPLKGHVFRRIRCPLPVLFYFDVKYCLMTSYSAIRGSVFFFF